MRSEEGRSLVRCLAMGRVPLDAPRVRREGTVGFLVLTDRAHGPNRSMG